MLQFKLWIYLAALHGFLVTTNAAQHYPNHAIYRNDGSNLQKRANTPQALPKTATKKPKDDPKSSKKPNEDPKSSKKPKEDSKSTRKPSNMTPADWELWDKFETYFRNVWKVPTLHANTPIIGGIPNYPIPGQGQNGSGPNKKNVQAKAPAPGTDSSKVNKGKPQVPVPGSESRKQKRSAAAANVKKGTVNQPSSAGSGAVNPKSPQASGKGTKASSGSDPLPFFPIPGQPDPLIDSQPVPGNGQNPVDTSSLDETPNNPGLPTVQELINFLDRRFPNGRDDSWNPSRDIRHHLMFWSGGTPEEARRAAGANNWYVMADLFTGDPERRWIRFIRQTTNNGRNYADIRPMWRRMALAMATWARGRVRYRIHDRESATNPLNTWNEIERPTLQNAGITIDWVDTQGRARGPEYPDVHPGGHPNNSNPPNGTGPPSKKSAKIPVPAKNSGTKKLRRREYYAILRRDLLIRSMVNQIKLRNVDRSKNLELLRRAFPIVQRNIEREEAIWF